MVSVIVFIFLGFPLSLGTGLTMYCSNSQAFSVQAMGSSRKTPALRIGIKMGPPPLLFALQCHSNFSQYFQKLHLEGHMVQKYMTIGNKTQQGLGFTKIK